jgi:hypothetical protein
MVAAAIRSFGIVTLAVEALLLLAFNRQRFLDGPLPWRTIIAMWLYLFCVALIGVGLLLLRKWAAIVFVLVLVIFPTWLTIASIGEAPWGFHLGMAAVDIALILPIIIIVRSWKLMSWRGKWLL